MVDGNTVVKGVGPDISPAVFLDWLHEKGSPALSRATEVYDYCLNRHIAPSFLLGMFWIESQAGTDPNAIAVNPPPGTHSWGNTTEPSFGHPGLGPPYVRGRFTRYPDWYAGGISTVARMVEHAPYDGKTTVAAICNTWAPPSENDTRNYVEVVCRVMDELRAREAQGGTVGRVPPPPATNHIVTVPPRQNGVGLNVNSWNRIPKGSVIHSMGGTLKGTDGYFQGATCPALTDYGIGQTNYQGSGFAQIIQWCDPYGKIEPWASGPVKNPEGDGPAFLDYIGGSGKLNEAGVSVEHDDTTRPDGSVGAVGGQPVSVYQWSSSVWLQAWIHAEMLGQTADTFEWNMYHYEFTGKAYKTCPNPRITNFTQEHQDATRAIMRHFQEGIPYPAGGVFINGLRLNLPTNGQEDEMDQFPAESVTPVINSRGEAILVINYGGTVVENIGINVPDAGTSWRNAANEEYDRSLRNNVFEPWSKREG